MKRHEPTREQELRRAITTIRVVLNDVHLHARPLQNEMQRIRLLAEDMAPGPRIEASTVEDIVVYVIGMVQKMLPDLEKYCLGDFAWGRWGRPQLVVDNTKKRAVRRRRRTVKA